MRAALTWFLDNSCASKAISPLLRLRLRASLPLRLLLPLLAVCTAPRLALPLALWLHLVSRALP